MALGHGEGSWRAHHAPGGSRSSIPSSSAWIGHHSDDDDMTSGEELSALVGNGATMHGRAWGERGNDDELTAVPMVLLKGSGVRRRERIDGRGGRRWRWGRCRARGSFGFCKEDQNDEAELTDYSEECSRG